MKKISLKIFLSLVILFYPSLLFAGSDPLKDLGLGITTKLESFSGAVSTGINSRVGSAISAFKSTTGIAVGMATGNADLANRVASSNWRQAISTNLPGVTKTILGTTFGAVGGLMHIPYSTDIANTMATSNWHESIGGAVSYAKSAVPDFSKVSIDLPTAAGMKIVVPYSDYIRLSNPANAGKQTMADVTNYSKYRKF